MTREQGYESRGSKEDIVVLLEKVSETSGKLAYYARIRQAARSPPKQSISCIVVTVPGIWSVMHK
jgi:hypothetical protein